MQRELTALTKFDQFEASQQEWSALGEKILKLATLEAKTNMSLKEMIEQHQSELATMDEGEDISTHVTCTIVFSFYNHIAKTYYIVSPSAHSTVHTLEVVFPFYHCYVEGSATIIMSHTVYPKHNLAVWVLCIHPFILCSPCIR